jgi:hypothetical protein
MKNAARFRCPLPICSIVALLCLACAPGDEAVALPFWQEDDITVLTVARSAAVA